jgi:hypothetical protein
VAAYYIQKLRALACTRRTLLGHLHSKQFSAERHLLAPTLDAAIAVERAGDRIAIFQRDGREWTLGFLEAKDISYSQYDRQLGEKHTARGNSELWLHDYFVEIRTHDTSLPLIRIGLLPKGGSHHDSKQAQKARKVADEWVAFLEAFNRQGF